MSVRQELEEGSAGEAAGGNTIKGVNENNEKERQSNVAMRWRRNKR
jgi:hypothetical protein